MGYYRETEWLVWEANYLKNRKDSDSRIIYYLLYYAY